MRKEKKERKEKQAERQRKALGLLRGMAALALAAMLAACGMGNAGVLKTPVEADSLSGALEAAPEEYGLFYEAKTYSLGLYEPEESCYLGGYVLSSKLLNFSSAKLDELSGKKHAVSSYNLKAGNPFPDTWVLSCIAEMRTPLISIKPQNTYNPFDKKLIDKMAGDFGEYYVPIFVEFFPEPESITSDPEEYADFFRYARKAFAEKASNVAFVWSVDQSQAASSARYYPGDEWTDWVGIHIFERLNGAEYSHDGLKALDYFYYAYQKTKPVMISQLGVSHYNSKDKSYRSNEAAAEIKRVYERVAKSYPRVKLINYMDVDEISLGAGAAQDNFLLTQIDRILDSYKEAIQDPRFAESTDVSSTGEVATQLMKSPFPAYKVGDDILASANSFLYDLNTKGLSGGETLFGEKYYSLGGFAKNARRLIEVDDLSKRVIISAAQAKA
jgi:hypothetical protein